MKRLLENHPLTKKLRAFEKYMDDNNIQIEWNGYRMIISDNETLQSAYIKDAESYEDCDILPHLCETVLTKD